MTLHELDELRSDSQYFFRLASNLAVVDVGRVIASMQGLVECRRQGHGVVVCLDRSAHEEADKRVDFEAGPFVARHVLVMWRDLKGAE